MRVAIVDRKRTISLRREKDRGLERERQAGGGGWVAVGVGRDLQREEDELQGERKGSVG